MKSPIATQKPWGSALLGGWAADWRSPAFCDAARGSMVYPIVDMHTICVWLRGCIHIYIQRERYIYITIWLSNPCVFLNPSKMVCDMGIVHGRSWFVFDFEGVGDGAEMIPMVDVGLKTHTTGYHCATGSIEWGWLAWMDGINQRCERIQDLPYGIWYTLW